MAVPFPHFCLALHSKAGLNTSLSWLPHGAKDGTESAKGALRCDAARFEVELIGKEETATEMECFFKMHQVRERAQNEAG